MKRTIFYKYLIFFLMIILLSSIISCNDGNKDNFKNVVTKYNKFGIQEAHYSMWDTGTVYESGSAQEMAEQGCAMFDILDELHIKNFRYTIFWGLVERAANGDYNWGPHDQLISYLTDKEIDISIMIEGVNYSYYDNPEKPAIVSDVDYHNAWLKFIEAVVTRYGDKVKKWEIGNEEDSKYFWYPTPNPDDYSNFLLSTVNKIKSVQPNAFIITGGVTPSPTTGDYYGINEFLTECFENGILDYIDAVGIHPYRTLPEGGFDAQFFSGPNLTESFEEEITALKNLIASYKTGIELWNTESGYVNFDYVDKNNQNKKLYSQVKYISRSMLVEYANDLKGLTYFRLRVNHQFPGTVQPKFQGLVEDDTDYKRPAFTAFKTISEIIGPDNVEYVKTVKTTGKISGIDTEVRIEIYKKSNQYIAAYWMLEIIDNDLKTVKRITLEIEIPEASYLVRDILKSTTENIDYTITQNGNNIIINNLPITDYPYILYCE